MMLAAEPARPLPFWAFGVAYILPLLFLPALWLGGAAWYAVPTFVFVLVPVCDHLLGLYRYNPSPAETEALLQSAAFRWMTWSWVPVQAVLVLGGAWLMAQGGLAPFEQLGLVLSVGIATGAIGITLAHELLHKTSAWERRLSQMLLLLVSYMHFYIEHLRGHHRRVATPDDPASSRLGESFYRFYGRTVVGSWRDAWAIEAQRLGKNSCRSGVATTRCFGLPACPCCWQQGWACSGGPWPVSSLWPKAWWPLACLRPSTTSNTTVSAAASCVRGFMKRSTKPIPGTPTSF